MKEDSEEHEDPCDGFCSSTEQNVPETYRVKPNVTQKFFLEVVDVPVDLINNNSLYGTLKQHEKTYKSAQLPPIQQSVGTASSVDISLATIRLEDTRRTLKQLRGKQLGRNNITQSHTRQQQIEEEDEANMSQPSLLESGSLALDPGEISDPPHSSRGQWEEQLSPPPHQQVVFPKLVQNQNSPCTLPVVELQHIDAKSFTSQRGKKTTAMIKARNFLHEIKKQQNVQTNLTNPHLRFGASPRLNGGLAFDPITISTETFRLSALSTIASVSEAKAKEMRSKCLVNVEISKSKAMLPVQFASEYELSEILKEKVSKYLRRASFLLAKMFQRKAFSQWLHFLFLYNSKVRLESTITIQTCARGHLARKEKYALSFKRQIDNERLLRKVENLLSRRQTCAVVLQRFAKNIICLQGLAEYRVRRRKIVAVQLYWRARQARIHVILEKLNRKHRNDAAIEIQKVFRGWKGRKRFKQIMYEAFIERVQAELDNWDAMIARGFIEQGAAIVIERSWRHYRKFKVKLRFIGHQVCIKIQKVWRGYFARKSFSIPKADTSTISTASSSLETEENGCTTVVKPDADESAHEGSGESESRSATPESSESKPTGGHERTSGFKYSHPLYTRKAVKIQTFVRRCIHAHQFKQLKQRTVKIQSVARMFMGRTIAERQHDYLRTLAHFKDTGSIQFHTQVLPALQLKMLLSVFLPSSNPHGTNEVHFLFDYWLSNAVSNVSGMTNSMVVRLMKEMKVLKHTTQQQLDLLFADVLVKVHARNKGPKTKVVDLFGFRMILVGVARLVFGRMAKKLKTKKLIGKTNPQKGSPDQEVEATQEASDTQTKGLVPRTPQRQNHQQRRKGSSQPASEAQLSNETDPLCDISGRDRESVGRLFKEVIFASKLGKQVRRHLEDRAHLAVTGAVVKIQQAFRAKYFAERNFQSAALHIVQDIRTEAKRAWAVGVVQQAVRRRLAKQQLLALAQNTIICYRGLDPGTQPYWYNPKSGSKFTKLPKVLRGRPTFDTIYIPSEEEQYVITCESCGTRTVERCCTDCGMEMYCEPCFERVHSQGARAKHVVATVATCVECLFQMGTRVCNTCKDAYCDTCFLQTHATGGMKFHYYRPLVAMCEYCPHESTRRCARWYYEGVKHCVPCFNQRFASDYNSLAWQDRVKLPFHSTEIQSVIRRELENKRQAEVAAYTKTLQAKQQEATLMRAVVKIQARFRGRQERLRGKGIDVKNKLHQRVIRQKAKEQGILRTLINKSKNFLWGEQGLLNPEAMRIPKASYSSARGSVATGRSAPTWITQRQSQRDVIAPKEPIEIEPEEKNRSGRSKSSRKLKRSSSRKGGLSKSRSKRKMTKMKKSSSKKNLSGKKKRRNKVAMPEE